MTVSAVPHLNFTGNAREALEFYHSVFGGQLMIGTYGEGGVPQDSATSDRVTFAPVAPDSPDAGLVSFGMVTAENGFTLAAYDVFGGPAVGLPGIRPPRPAAPRNSPTPRRSSCCSPVTHSTRSPTCGPGSPMAPR